MEQIKPWLISHWMVVPGADKVAGMTAGPGGGEPTSIVTSTLTHANWYEAPGRVHVFTRSGSVYELDRATGEPESLEYVRGLPARSLEGVTWGYFDKDGKPLGERRSDGQWERWRCQEGRWVPNEQEDPLPDDPELVFQSECGMRSTGPKLESCAKCGKRFVYP
jgi:hypothetical protein